MEAWEKARAWIRGRISEQVFETWFGPVALHELGEDAAVLAVPNNFFKDWLSNNFADLIQEALLVETGRAVAVRFTVTAGDAEPAAPADPGGPHPPAEAAPDATALPEDPDVPQALADIRDPRFPFDPQTTSYFLGRETVLCVRRKGWARVHQNLFAWMSQNARDATSFFGLPPGSVVELGVRVQI